jgi:nucleotidyltransferase substrate binding protein (TIGR01987 family)
MDENQDIRWQQRFNSFQQALGRLKEIVNLYKPESLSELEKEGLIQRFEYTFELSWKMLQDVLKYRGYTDIAGPNMTLQQAFKDGYITDHDGWRNMKRGRETTSHTYNEGSATQIVKDIYNEYAKLLIELENTMLKIKTEENN